MSLRATILIVAMGLTGCANASASEGEFTQAQADAIAAKCGASRGILWVEGDGGVRFDPPLDLSYEVSACILQEIKKSGVTKFGFVGNEKLAEPEDQ